MTQFVIVALALFAALLAWNAVEMAVSVGKPRKPISPRLAVATIIVDLFMVAVLILTVTRLHW